MLLIKCALNSLVLHAPEWHLFKDTHNFGSSFVILLLSRIRSDWPINFIYFTVHFNGVVCVFRSFFVLSLFRVVFSNAGFCMSHELLSLTDLFVSCRSSENDRTCAHMHLNLFTHCTWLYETKCSAIKLHPFSRLCSAIIKSNCQMEEGKKPMRNNNNSRGVCVCVCVFSFVRALC